MTQADFHLSEAISGVNMRLAAGGVREMHWHLAAEWAFMSYGAARVTVLDPQGRAYVADVKAGDLWYFPSGYPHSLQGLGPDGCEFILCFDDGKASEFNTLLVTDWMLHTPPDVLALNFGMPAKAFSGMAIHNLWIYQGVVPGPLAADQDAVKSAAGAPPNPFVFSLSDMPGSPRASWAEKAAQALPSFLLAVGIIAASHALAGRTDEARRAMLDPRQLDPMLRISNLKE